MFSATDNREESLKNRFTRFNLERSLRPMWKMSYYSGLLFDWCKLIPNQSPLSILIHCICIAFSLVIVLFVIAFLFGQLLVEIWRMESFHSIMPNLIWLSWMPSAFGTHIDYLLRRNGYLQFFTEWKTMELLFLPKGSGPQKKLSKTFVAFYAGHYIYNFGLLGAASFSLFGNTRRIEHPLTMSDYSQLTEIIPVPILNTIHLVAIMVCLVFMLLMDIVPAVVYCNAARAVQFLRDDIHDSIKEKSDDAHCCNNKEQDDESCNNKERTDIQEVWYRYETLRGLVKKADNLFGPMMIFNHGITFFIICALLFTLMANFRQLSMNDAILYTLGLIGCLYRMISAVALMSRLHGTAEPLRGSLLHLQVTCFDLLTKRDRGLLRAFLSRLEYDHMAADPSGFYQITPKIFLTLLSLVVTYTIVLLQS